MPAPFRTSYTPTSVQISHGPTAVVFQALDHDGAPRPLTGSSLVAVFTGLIAVQVSNLDPTSLVEVWAFSEPTLLGTFRVPPGGSGLITVKLPPSIQPGDHTIVVVGRAPDAATIEVRSGITVVHRVSATATAPAEPATPGEPAQPAESLSYTGVNPFRELYLALLLLLLGAGLILAGTGRRPAAWASPFRSGAHGPGAPLPLRADAPASRPVMPVTPATAPPGPASAPAAPPAAPPATPAATPTATATAAPPDPPPTVDDWAPLTLPGWLLTPEPDAGETVSIAQWLSLTTWLATMPSPRGTVD